MTLKSVPKQQVFKDQSILPREERKNQAERRRNKIKIMYLLVRLILCPPFFSNQLYLQCSSNNFYIQQKLPYVAAIQDVSPSLWTYSQLEIESSTTSISNPPNCHSSYALHTFLMCITHSDVRCNCFFLQGGSLLCVQFCVLMCL